MSALCNRLALFFFFFLFQRWVASLSKDVNNIAANGFVVTLPSHRPSFLEAVLPIFINVTKSALFFFSLDVLNSVLKMTSRQCFLRSGHKRDFSRDCIFLQRNFRIYDYLNPVQKRILVYPSLPYFPN